MKTVLITGIGGDVAQSVAAIIRKYHSDWRLVGTDIHSEHAGSLFVDDLYTLPMASDTNYLYALYKLIDHKNVDFVIPITEAELDTLHNSGCELSSDMWIYAGSEALEAGLDKYATAKMLEKLGIPAPWTILASMGKPVTYPCIFKSRKGSGSSSVFVVKDDNDVSYLLKRFPDSILQELLSSPEQEVTCAVYRTRDERVLTLQMRRRLALGGFTGWATVVDDKSIHKMCESIAHSLNLRGSMNVQLRVTDNGPRIFEINPRFSSTTLMRHKLGYTDVQWSLDEMNRKQVVFPYIEQGSIVARVQDAAIIHI
jgi:carbamoyl-phosphate synthase large subunit